MSEILDFQSGREAFLAGKPRDRRRNEHWLRGWDHEQEDAIAWAEEQEKKLD